MSLQLTDLGLLQTALIAWAVLCQRNLSITVGQFRHQVQQGDFGNLAFARRKLLVDFLNTEVRQFGGLYAALGQFVGGVTADHAVDNDVCCDVPQHRVTLSTAGHMLQGRMQQFVRHQATKLALVLLVDKHRVEPQHTPIRAGRVHAIAHSEVCEQRQGAEKRMVTADAHQRSLQALGDVLRHAGPTR